MKNLANDLTDLQKIQDLSEQVDNNSTSSHPANSDLATSHCFTNGMISDRQMILIESRFRHGDTIDHQLILYIHVIGSFNSHAEHPNLLGQGFNLFIYDATTDDLRSK